MALQDFPISSTPSRPLEGVVYGFEVAADDLTAVTRAAEERKLKWHGPVEYAAPCPIKESLFVLDPDGNTVELSIRRDPVSDKPQGKIVPLRRISHVRVEVTDLEQGKSWYRDTFGLTEDRQVPGEEQVHAHRAEHGTVGDSTHAWIKSRSEARAPSRDRTSIFGSRRNCIRLSLNGSTEKNTTGGLIPRKFPGTNRADTRSMGMIPSVIGYRSGIGLNAAVTSRLLKKAHMLRCARPISRQRTNKSTPPLRSSRASLLRSF